MPGDSAIFLGIIKISKSLLWSFDFLWVFFWSGFFSDPLSELHISVRTSLNNIKDFFSLLSLIQIRHWMGFLQLLDHLLNQKNDFFCEAISWLVMSNMSVKLKVAEPYPRVCLFAKMEKWKILIKDSLSLCHCPFGVLMPWGASLGYDQAFVLKPCKETCGFTQHSKLEICQ